MTKLATSRAFFNFVSFFELQEVPRVPESRHSDALQRGLMEAFRKWLLRETLSHYNIIGPRSCWETQSYAIVSMIVFHLHKPLESFDRGLAWGFNWAEGARQEFPRWKGRTHGITHRKSVWDCADGTGDAFVAIAGKLLSDKTRVVSNQLLRCKRVYLHLFRGLYPFDEIQEAQALQTQPLSPSAGVLSLFQVFDSTLMLI